MAPSRLPAVRRTTLSQNEHVPQLGKVGRKTGLTLAERERDEDGFEAIDHMFSSPDKDIAAPNRDDSPESDEEQDMDLDDATVMGPATTRKLQQHQGGRPSLPRARSPVKTNLQSPARQNPHLGPTSSPTRGSVVTSQERSPKQLVARKLNFSMTNSLNKPPTEKTNGVKNSGNGKMANGRSHTVVSSDSDDDDEEDVPARISGRRREEEEEEEEEDGMQMLGAADDGDEDAIDPLDGAEEPDDEPEEEEVQEAKASSKAKSGARKGRKPKTAVIQDAEDETEAEPEVNPPTKRKGRPKASPEQAPKKSSRAVESSLQVKKRGRPVRNSTGEAEEESKEESRGAKRQKTAPAAAAVPSVVTKEKGKPGRKRKSDANTDSPAIQRGPPLPKGRGLVTARRDESGEMKTTRSGRSSFKPLEWWRGEHVEYDEDTENVFDDAKKGRFKMPTIKGVVRKVHDSPEPKRPGRRAGNPSKSKRRATTIREEEEEIERDDWEEDPGRVAGEIICWYPHHEFAPPTEEDQVEVMEDDLAISEAAIQLKDIKDATFKFAKTLTMPFFGSGIVDLPPGAEKRPKNSRKMHLVFFVHTGSVQVTIAQTTFGIGKGGMFFVPRGNHYSILNESEVPARLFFSQGCEVLVQPDPEGEAEGEE